MTAVRNGPRVVLSAGTGAKETVATFFSLDADEIDNVAPQALTSTARGLQLALQQADPDPKPPAMLKGVLVLGRAVERAVAADPRRAAARRSVAAWRRPY